MDTVCRWNGGGITLDKQKGRDTDKNKNYSQALMDSKAITSSNESHLGIIVGDSAKTSVQCVAAIKQENNTLLAPKWFENN